MTIIREADEIRQVELLINSPYFAPKLNLTELQCSKVIILTDMLCCRTLLLPEVA